MGDLTAYGREITSIFQLLGTLENDITKSIAWALCRCPVFLKHIIYKLLNIDIDPEKVSIRYQEYQKDKGITDLELTDEDRFYIIIEAKRGWILPSAEQLTLYSKREKLIKSAAMYKAIVSMSECSAEYADAYLPAKEINGIPIMHLPWREIYDIANTSKAESSIAQRNLLSELTEYLGGIMTMQTKESNWVYVVSLGTSKPNRCDLSWMGIVKKYNKYFCPIGTKGWPKEPPNYIAFRYGGKLQSIHHIESYTVTKNIHTEVPDIPDEEWEDHFVFDLGPAIIPQHEVKTGKLYPNARVWAMLDTLLTASTVAEAIDMSKKRIQAEE